MSLVISACKRTEELVYFDEDLILTDTKVLFIRSSDNPGNNVDWSSVILGSSSVWTVLVRIVSFIC